MDRGGDYLDYLRPFVGHALATQRNELVSAEMTVAHIMGEFGLVVPERTVEIVLRRMAKSGVAKRLDRKYYATHDALGAGLDVRRAEAAADISTVAGDFRRFTRDSRFPIQTDELAIAAICAFLSEFDVSCLRAYLRGTAIPTTDHSSKQEIVLLSSYLRHIIKHDAGMFSRFMVLVRGHMLANALLCPDLDTLAPTYRGVAFYLDTPILVQWMGLEGDARRSANADLVRLLRHLGGEIVVFTHTRDELVSVIRGAADQLASARPMRGEIVLEARRGGLSRSDLLLVAEEVGEHLSKLGVRVERTPAYTRRFQIDEHRFERVLDEQVRYMNPQARLHDINSVRSIYALRRGRVASSIEQANAVLVTSNRALAVAASDYERAVEESEEVSSVITAFSLANSAWLKAPAGGDSVPRTQVLAFAYAALSPSEGLWNRYMREIERLEEEGTISVRDLQLLRSAPGTTENLMHLTAGDESAISHETAVAMFERVRGEMEREWKDEEAQWRRKEEVLEESLKGERSSHRTTQEDLENAVESRREVIGRIFWDAHRRAERVATWVQRGAGTAVVGLGLGVMTPIGTVLGFGVWGAVAAWATWVVAALSIYSLISGWSVRRVHAPVLRWWRRRTLVRESDKIGVSVADLESAGTAGFCD